MRNVILAALIFFFPAAAGAQAFGVNMGDPVSKYGGKPAGGKNQYVITVPLPNAEFESYVAMATPQTGICKVSGIGKTHESDDYGTSVRASYEALRSVLMQKYGRAKSFDFINAGALWDEPREFVWSVYKNERTLSSYWDRKEGSNMPDDVEIIGLRIRAVSSRGAYIALGYEFTNISRCSEIAEASENRGL